ncbi:TPA: hypothetical protein EYN09_20830 [Candidatus Poribacteria bacterium]|nr:hypothetical protein [Candidatus Poribacteria bacterium]
MLAVDLNKTLFYRHRGFDREGFAKSVELAKDRLKQLRSEIDVGIDFQFVNDPSIPHSVSVEKIPIVSTTLSVPHSVRVPYSAPNITQSVPNYQQINSSINQIDFPSLDLYG